MTSVLEGQRRAEAEREWVTSPGAVYHYSSTPWSDLPLNYLPCPHQHFKAPNIDRDALSREDHIALLSTPKGYRWIGDANLQQPPAYTMLRPAKRRPRPDRKPIDGPEQRYIHEFLADVWNMMSPEMIERLKKILVDEFGMSNAEADDFIAEQADIVEGPKKSGCLVDLDVRSHWLKEFRRLLTCKITDYIVTMMCARRSKRTRVIAEEVLKHLCDITGERCTLSKPKSKIQRIQVFIADRVAAWLSGVVAESDKDMCKKLTSGEGDDGTQPKGPAGPKRRKPKPVLKPKPLRKPRKEIITEQEPRPSSEGGSRPSSQPQSKEATAAGTPKGPSKETSRPASAAASKPSSKEPSRPGSKPTSRPESKPTSRPESKPTSRPESKPTSKPASQPESKLGSKQESKLASKQESKQLSKQESKVGSAKSSKPASPEKIKSPSKGDSGVESKTGLAEEEEVEAGVEAEESEVPATEPEGASEVAGPEEAEVTAEEVAAADEDASADEGAATDEQAGAPEDRVEEEEVGAPESEGEGPGEVGDEPTALKVEDGIDEVEEIKDEQLAEPVEEGGGLVGPRDPMDVIKEWIEETPSEETPRQDVVSEIIGDHIREEMGEVTPEEDQAIIDVSEKAGTWVDKLVADAEKQLGVPSTELISKHVTFHVKQGKSGCYYDVKRVDAKTTCEKTITARAPRVTVTKTNICNKPADTKPMKTPQELKEWAEWASGVVNVAEQWVTWIDKTCNEAEKKANERQKGNEIWERDWKQFKKDAHARAIEWKRNRKYIKESAKIWEDKISALAKRP